MKTNWTIEGNVMLRHNDSTISAGFPGTVPLEHVEVNVSAREKVMGVWGPWNSWDKKFTDSNGHFKIKKEKDKSNRQFKVEVQFKDDTLKVYPENDGFMSKVTEAVTDIAGDVLGLITQIHALGDIVDKTEDALEQLLEQTGRIAYNVRWYTILKEDKNDKSHSAGTVNLGNLTFGDGDEDLGNSIARKHALVWFVYKKIFKTMNTFQKDVRFLDKKPVALKFPHDNTLISDKVESSYSDPFNQVIFIIRNSRTDQLDVDTIMHELMHIWAYQHSKNEKGLAWQLIVHGGTHDELQKKSYVAFHEGFAEWASNRLTNIIFGTNSSIYGETTDTGLPLSRGFLKGKGIKKESEIDRSEYGWMSLFNILMTPDLHRYDFNASQSKVTLLSSVSVPSGHICSSPVLSFEEILDIFNENEKAGLKKQLKREDMNLDDFLNRAKKLYPSKISTSKINAIKKLLNPAENVAAVDVICPAPTAMKKPPADYKPPRDLHEPPVSRKRSSGKTVSPKVQVKNVTKGKKTSK
ncbi:MAG: hypothetical protein KDC42_02830 [Ignavibacteriae bacterium]|nr:hypothetical protein [Ignavibacteriota bacterium]